MKWEKDGWMDEHLHLPAVYFTLKCGRIYFTLELPSMISILDFTMRTDAGCPIQTANCIGLELFQTKTYQTFQKFHVHTYLQNLL